MKTKLNDARHTQTVEENERCGNKFKCFVVHRFNKSKQGCSKQCFDCEFVENL
jgi:hypothetical protein